MHVVRDAVLNISVSVCPATRVTATINVLVSLSVRILHTHGRQLCAIFDKNINLCLHFTCVSDFAVCDDWWFLAIIQFSSSDLCFFTA